MARISYVNGRYLAHKHAQVSVEDRGYQFSDAVYEVWSVMGGRLADLDGHLIRLQRSLNALRIDRPMSMAALMVVLNEVVRRNHIQEGMVYLQISRGVAPRDHAFPVNTKPSVVITARSVDRAAADLKAQSGVKIISQPDIRWGRCDIKTVSLLPNVLAKQIARDQGAHEVVFVDRDGFVSEGASTNVYMVDQSGVVKTRTLSANILAGVTRANLLQLASERQIRIEEGAFTLAELKSAREVFITAATSFLMPVICVDGHIIHDGKPGPLSAQLRAIYIEQARLSAGIV
jgi:D-alanine transaminase